MNMKNVKKLDKLIIITTKILALLPPQILQEKFLILI